MFVTLSMLILLAIQFAVMGGAFAGGAWVIWRLLERRAGREGGPSLDSSRSRSVP
jgi:hypothetical protein